MIQFFAGMAVGAVVIFFVLGLIMIRDENDSDDPCKNCLYAPYSDGERSCEKCHGVDV